MTVLPGAQVERVASGGTIKKPVEIERGEVLEKPNGGILDFTNFGKKHESGGIPLSEEDAPSTNAISNPSSEFTVLSILIYLNSIFFFHSKNLVFNISVNTIELSSQQVKLNHPITSFLLLSMIVWYIF